LQANSEYFISPFDSWGFNGNISYLGLPNYSIETQYNEFSMNDPVYGNVIFSWMNPRYTNIDFYNNLNVNISPISIDSERMYSRFDYYRGDYSYGNFGILFGGKIADGLEMIFHGENLNFDGWAGLYGNDIYKNGESLTQNFCLDFIKTNSDYNIETGTSYRKFMPGLITYSNPDLPGSILGNGKFSENRNNYYLKVNYGSSKDSTSVGFQISNYLYENYQVKKEFSFNGESNKISGFLHKYYFFNENTIKLSFRPLKQDFFIQHGKDQSQYLIKGSAEVFSNNNILNYNVNFGFTNKYLTGSAKLRRTLINNLDLITEYNRSYTLYPMIYKSHKAISLGSIELENGFLVNQASLELQYSNLLLESSIKISNVNGNYQIPFKSDYSDTLFAFNKINLNDLFLSGNIQITLPWRTEINGSYIFSPTVDRDAFLNTQMRSKITQYLTFFHGNLNLFCSGEVIYYNGGDNLVWFDEFRGTGYTSDSYYTNERLVLNMKAGVKVGSLKMFYDIYNIEGRQWTPIAGMPIHSRLSILGFEWYFFD